MISTFVIVVTLSAFSAQAGSSVYPGAAWETRAPEQVGMDVAKLDALAKFMGRRGCVVRHGYMIYTWGDAAERGDVASACKPWFTFFLFKAVEEKLLPSLDSKVVTYQPCLRELNARLNYKDRGIAFRHMANQISCYGVQEAPGAAFDYNDYQIALFFDTLLLKVYRATYETIDNEVLHKRLTDVLQCQDNPTFFVFHKEDRAGRFGISPRDFARFGLLYLHEGNWNGTQLISRKHARMAVNSPLPNSIPRTTGVAAEMCPGQRSIGSENIPDNQTDHNGSYSFAWWLNGVDRKGERQWPDAPHDIFAALGHIHGMRGMAVFPSLDVVVSWNDTNLGDMPDESNPLNEAFRLVAAAVEK